MANIFLDTSALAKLYHKEAGSDYLKRVLEQPGKHCMISRLSIVEMESVLAIKVRSGQLDDAGMQMARRRLRADIAQGRILVAPPVEEKHFHLARKLLVKYGVAEGLRTVDALQLSMALDLQQAGIVGVMVAADQRLCRVAELTGCSAIDPQTPRPLGAE